MTTRCVDVTADGIWLGEEMAIDCLSPEICARHDKCSWRLFHKLKPEQFARRASPSPQGKLDL